MTREHRQNAIQCLNLILYAPNSLDECHAWFHLYGICRAVRNGGAKNADWNSENMSPAEFVPTPVTAKERSASALERSAIGLRCVNVINILLYHRVWLKWTHVWQNMYQIDYGLLCICDVLNIVIISKMISEFQILSDRHFKYTPNHNKFDTYWSPLYLLKSHAMILIDSGGSRTG